jgi:hypothetical protein
LKDDNKKHILRTSIIGNWGQRRKPVKNDNVLCKPIKTRQLYDCKCNEQFFGEKKLTFEIGQGQWGIVFILS